MLRGDNGIFFRQLTDYRLRAAVKGHDTAYRRILRD